MNNVLENMIKIYKPNGKDWMGYKLSFNNPYTYHHIIERRNGGIVSIDNGAILTKKAHIYLNYLDGYCPDGYDAYQEMFRYINSLRKPLTLDIYEELYDLAYRIEVEKVYKFYSESRLDSKKKTKRRKFV